MQWWAKTSNLKVCNNSMWHEQYVDKHYYAIGRFFTSAFLAVCFILAKEFVQGFSVSTSICGISSRQKVDKKWPLSVPENGCHDFVFWLWWFEFFHWHWMCMIIALIVTYSQVYSEMPMIHLLSQCNPGSCHFDLHNMHLLLALQPLIFLVSLFSNQHMHSCQ